MRSGLLSRPDRQTIRRIGIVLLVLVLVAGAGCSAIGGDDGGGGDDGNATADTGAAEADTGGDTGGTDGGTDSGGSDGGTDTGGDQTTGGVNLIDHVPANQNIVMSVDMAVTQDQTTQQLLNAGGEQDPTTGEDFQQDLDEIQAELGLDPTAVDEIVVFGQTEDVPSSVGSASDEQVGILANTGWTQDQLLSVFEADGSSSLVEESYQESGVLYRIQDSDDGPNDGPTYLGVLGDGAYVLGDETSVRGSLDVAYAGGASLGGELLSAYQNTRDGYVSFAMLMPEETGTGTDQAEQFAQDMQAISGVYYTSGNQVGMEARIVMSTQQSATQMTSIAQLGISQIEQENPEAAPLLEALTIGQEGTDMTMTFEQDVDTLIQQLESQQSP